ncbi:PREDICTED: uncharacterized protein LOC109352938 [Lupinus angustifolius]|uniref:uncharacterized protein LOC109352938 n=1 Tax=Lupinus angustifolius TaxID=3871 RepID=UPI00092F1B02|nr:PREDICTED: uncharacterized protein LOC109352938 [Lupinus angustifolius]
MENYLIKVKSLAGKITLASSLVSTSDLIIQTLNGLDSKYNHVVVKPSDQITPSWVDLQAELLTFESRIEQLNNLTNLTLNATANVANRYDHRGNRYNSNNNWRGSTFRSWKRGGGRGRSSKTPCQFCGKSNHTAIDCFHRFDKSYSGSNYLVDNDRQGSHNSFLASQNSIQDYDWYFDSGASNNVTHQTDKVKELTDHHGNPINDTSLAISEDNLAEINTKESQDLNNVAGQHGTNLSEGDTTHGET